MGIISYALNQFELKFKFKPSNFVTIFTTTFFAGKYSNGMTSHALKMWNEAKAVDETVLENAR